MKDISKRLNKVKEKIGFIGQTFNTLEYLKAHIPKLGKDVAKEWKATTTGLLQAQNGLDSAIFAA